MMLAEINTIRCQYHSGGMIEVLGTITEQPLDHWKRLRLPCVSGLCDTVRNPLVLAN